MKRRKVLTSDKWPAHIGERWIGVPFGHEGEGESPVVAGEITGREWFTGDCTELMWDRAIPGTDETVLVVRFKRVTKPDT